MDKFQVERQITKKKQNKNIIVKNIVSEKSYNGAEFCDYYLLLTYATIVGGK